MYTTFLILLMWPLVLAGVTTIFLRQRLRRPTRFFLAGLIVCIGLELSLSGGYPLVAAGWDAVGMFFKLMLGGVVLYILFRLDQRSGA